jgi:hypothetical protein
MIRRLLVTFLGCLGVAGIALPASASATTFHGGFSQASRFCQGQLVENVPEAGGVWNLNVDPQGSPQVTVRLSYSGKLEAAWGYNQFLPDSDPSPTVYAYTNGTWLSVWLDATDAANLAFQVQILLGGSCSVEQGTYDTVVLSGGNR